MSEFFIMQRPQTEAELRFHIDAMKDLMHVFIDAEDWGTVANTLLGLVQMQAEFDEARQLQQPILPDDPRLV